MSEEKRMGETANGRAGVLFIEPALVTSAARTIERLAGCEHHGERDLLSDLAMLMTFVTGAKAPVQSQLRKGAT